MATEPEVIKFMAEYENRMKVSENRTGKLEEQTCQMMDLTVSVKELATNMASMLEEQKEQNERIKKLESGPKEKWDLVWRTVLTSSISVLAGAVAVGLFQIIF